MAVILFILVFLVAIGGMFGVAWLFNLIFEKTDWGGYLVGCFAVGWVLITIIAGISMLKSCATGDDIPTHDYYDAPRK